MNDLSYMVDAKCLSPRDEQVEQWWFDVLTKVSWNN